MVKNARNLEISMYLFILVGCHGDELGFLEDVGAERGVRQLEDVVGSNEVKARLVLVHGVEDRLLKGYKKDVVRSKSCSKSEKKRWIL